MIVTTTSTIEGHSITRYIAIVSGEVILGANIFRDMSAGIRNIIGGRTTAYEESLREARQSALQEMMQSAQQAGANAVVGVKVDYETIGNGMLMATACGTAVVIS
jgi:uncharacterized protein YbjQ (UPF0145 family)